MKITYPHHGKKYKLGPYTWSDVEIGDLAKAWIAISVAFAIVLGGAQFNLSFLIMVAVSGLTVGLGFLLHEMGHKFVAQRYGVWAEFRANYTMLLLALAMSFLGFIFAAPGAVVIGHNINVKQNGKIAAAGPLMNVILAMLFFGMGLFVQNMIISYGFMINSWLALFNMLPFGFFDGAKIFKWHRGVYAAMIIFAGFLVFIPFMLT